jgi:hypothetical protein
MFPFLSCEGSLVDTAFELEENVSEKRNTAKRKNYGNRHGRQRLQELS